jgi:hypothetical protein
MRESSPTLELICCSARGSASRIGSLTRPTMALLQGADAESDSVGETQPTATKAVRRPKKAIATP